MAVIQVTPEVLRAKANEIRSIKDEHDEAMARMRTLILGLNDTFKGQAHDALVAKYEGMQSTFTQFSQLIESYAAILDNNANVMENADQTLASQNRG